MIFFPILCILFLLFFFSYFLLSILVFFYYYFFLSFFYVFIFLYFLFDFDWTMIECNSDPYVIEGIGAKSELDRLQSIGEQWTKTVDWCLVFAQTKLKVTVEEIRQQLRTIKMAQSLINAIKQISEEHDVIILSDANQFFIDEILESNGLVENIMKIYTNPGIVEQNNVLRVYPFQTDGEHGCCRCPSNLCKGQVLENILLDKSYGRVIYAGDGGGDFCPTTRLGSNDFVLVRDDYPGSRKPTPLHKLIVESQQRNSSKEEAAEQEEEEEIDCNPLQQEIKANVKFWNHPDRLTEYIQNINQHLI
eukprot:TRINITY_DN7756_c0_g1_i2.p2 TRINITY_DN7756_c0_g1~~TRINITY_DN7756_c0_g1_i2.p2  ORF type:complete len:305 (-),score=29.43 TRINITY_DN7756_c0_g1_i2:49-963(-)